MEKNIFDLLQEYDKDAGRYPENEYQGEDVARWLRENGWSGTLSKDEV